MHAGATLEQARAAKGEARRVFGEIVGDVAVGIVPLGDGQFGLKVNLTTAPTSSVVLPSEIEGVPVQIDIVGTIQKR